jgi:hypothetical protein
MRRFTIIVGVIIVLLLGGALTSMLIATGGHVFPVLQQVGSLDASPTTILPWKANQLFILISFVLINIIGIAITLCVIFWLVDWGLKRSKAAAVTAAAEAASKE